MKQTAVEWLFEQIANTDWRNLLGEEKIKIFNQAKEMEKQQIETAYNKAVPFKYGKEYYEETFNK